MTYKVTARETSPIVRAIRTTQKSSGSKSWSSIGSLSARINIERVTDGQATPGYFARKKRGDILPFTDFFQYQAQTLTRAYSNTWETSSTVSDTVKGSGSNTLQNEYEVTEYDISYGHGLLDDVDAGPYLQDAAAAITGAGMDTLTFLAELHKVRRMFLNVVQRLGKLAARPGDVFHLSSLWLEGRYGWRTLRFDLISLDHAVRNFDSSRKRFTESRGTTYSYTTRVMGDSSTSAGVYTTYRDENIEIGVRGSICADISPARFRASAVTTAWELLPWSFVIDWLFSVGSMLESAQFLATVDNYAAGTGLKAMADVQYTVGNLRRAAGVTSWSFSRNQREAGEWIYRKPARVSLNPQSRLKFDVWKGVDSLALVVQQIAKLRARSGRR